MADVFISYARSTVECAEALARIVEADGHSVWYDARLPAHRTYSDVIQEQLDAAKAVLIIWSSEAVRSQWVRSEADRARNNGTLIQLRIDDCRLPMPFDQIECPLLEGWTGDGNPPTLSQVLTSVSELLGGESATASRMLAHAGATRRKRPEEADLLLSAAMKALQSGRPSEHAQAIPLLVEATGIAPEDAEIWGMLSVLYAARRSEVLPSERPAMIARARSAIRTARSLDAAEIRSRCAEVILIRTYRNWELKEREACAVLDRMPQQPLALFSLATVLAQTGRWFEAAKVAASIDRKRFLLPVVEQFTVQALWTAGDVVQAELAGDRAARRFPTHGGLFEARVALSMHSGRIGDAIHMIENAPGILDDYPPAKLETALLTARALCGSANAQTVIQRNLKAVDDGLLGPLQAAMSCASLGGLDECYALLDGYYFGSGPYAAAAPEAGDEDRSTAELFMPPMANAWQDERFAALTSAIQLGDFWDRSGVKPDCLG